MIVLAADMHKRSHTVAALVVATAELLDDKTAAVGDAGFRALLEWGGSSVLSACGRWRTAGTSQGPSSGS